LAERRTRGSAACAARVRTHVIELFDISERDCCVRVSAALWQALLGKAAVLATQRCVLH
jgi:hypothetical protein